MSRRIVNRDEYNDFMSKWKWNIHYGNIIGYINKLGKFEYTIDTFSSKRSSNGIVNQLMVSYGDEEANHVTGGQSIYRLKKLAYFDFLRKMTHGRKLMIEKYK